MTKEILEIGKISITITRKRNLKNLYIRIYPPDGEVGVSAPASLSTEDITQFVLKKMPSITKTREKMLTQNRQSKRRYVSGEAHYLWGKPYRLQVVHDGTKRSIAKMPKKIVMTVPEDATEDQREKLMTEWYRKEIKRALPAVTKRCEQRMSLHADEYRVKNMKTKWGTCNISERRIWINLQLVKKAPECLEYVVTHELVHLLERNHTHRFHALVEQFYPTWRDAKKLLEELPLDYMDAEEAENEE